MSLNINVFLDFICIDNPQHIKMTLKITVCIGHMVSCNFVRIVSKKANTNNSAIVVNKSVLKI